MICVSVYVCEECNVEKERETCNHNKKENEEKKEMTLDDNKHIDDAIACITSTAEQIASFTFWTSACSNQHISKKYC